MGNSQSSDKNKPDYQQHPRLGVVQMIEKEGEDSAIMLYSVPIKSEYEIDQWLKAKQLIQNSETEDVLFLPIKHSFEKQGFCGSSGNLKLTFQDYLFLLESEIQNREQLNKPFLETQMWYLLYNIVRAGKEYEKHDRKIGDVQPHNIVINEDGQTKIISVDSWPGQQSNYDKIVQSRFTKAFLGMAFSLMEAPQQCIEQFLKKGQYPPGVNKNIAEAFSVGMTLLEAASLKNCFDLYNKTGQFGVNIEALRRTIDSIRSQYSGYLVKTIESLLSVDPRSRPSCGQIHAVYVPYEHDIMNLDEFIFDMSSSEKCLATFQKLNPKYKSSQWNFSSLIGRPEPPHYNQYPGGNLPAVIQGQPIIRPPYGITHPPNPIPPNYLPVNQQLPPGARVTGNMPLYH